MNPRPIKSLEPLDGVQDSLYLTAANFEPRCLLASARMSPTYRTDEIVICLTTEYKEKGKTQDHLEKMKRRLELHSKEKVKVWEFPVDDSLEISRRLVELYKQNLNLFRNVTLDTTGFTPQTLLVLLRLIDNSRNDGALRLLHAEPRHYATELKSSKESWLTRGVNSVRAVPGFCGIQYPLKPKLLVVIIGHEGERAFITVRRHQPEKVIFVGQSPNQYHAGLDAIADRENMNMIQHFGMECLWLERIPASGIVESKKVIGDIVKLYGHRYNIFVSPCGTKLQLLGAYLAAREFIEIQLTFANPTVYNWSRYSKGATNLWEVSLESHIDNLE